MVVNADTTGDVDNRPRQNEARWLTGNRTDHSNVIAEQSVGRRRDLVFGVLLPSVSRGPRKCAYEAVLPAMDLAIRKAQRPGGLLEHFNITIEHRDTQCSSVYGPLAAFELYTKRKPG